MKTLMERMSDRIEQERREREVASFAVPEKFCCKCGARITRISERLLCRPCFSREGNAAQRFRRQACQS